MQLLESFSHGKRPDQSKNEDGFFFSEDWALVVDGCSSNEPALEGEEKSGVIARKLVLETIATLDPSATKEELFGACNNAIRSYYERNNTLAYVQAHPASRAGAYIAVVSSYRRELWILGDCQALIAGKHYANPKAIDTLMENLRVLFIEHALLEGTSEAELRANPERMRKKLAPIMALQSSFQNADAEHFYTYYTLDGFFSNYREVLTIPLPKEPVEVILATDGYPYLEPTLAASEAKLHEVIAADPLLYRTVRSVKGVEEGNDSFDDRTYLRFIV